MNRKQEISILWESIDKVLFGNNSPEIKLNENFQDYQVIKSSLIIEACEIIKFLQNTQPDKKIPITEDSVENHISFATSTTKLILESEKMKNHISKKVKSKVQDLQENSNVDTLIEENIQKTTLGVLIDNLLLSHALKESSENINSISDPLFDIVKDSYNLFKEELINLVTNLSK